MLFETLSNDLFLELFQYFNTSELFHTFYYLNSHLNKLIYIHLQKVSSLNFRSISKEHFHSICQYYLPSIKNDILSLIFSNDDETPQQIQLFFSYKFHFYQFSHLQSITFYEIYSSSIIRNILNDLSKLPNLLRLNFIDCYLSSLNNHLEKLTKLFFLQLHDVSRNKLQVISSPSIEYLSIKNAYININDIYHILKSHPNLQHVKFYVHLDNDEITITEKFPSIIKFELYDERLYAPKLNLINRIPEFTCLLRAMPNLLCLILETPFIFLDGYRWKCLIKNFLPNLRIFHIKMSIFFNHFDTIKTRIDYIFNSFQNSFWIDEHQWFIRCHWNSDNRYNQSIIFYTYPYRFFHLSIPNNYQWFRSTYPYDDDNNPWLSKSVHHLSYNSINQNSESNHTNSSSSPKLNRFFQFNSKKTRSFSLTNDSSTIIPSSLEKTILQITSITPNIFQTYPILLFPNIYQLTIEFPIDDYFWRIIPMKFKRLTILNIKNIDLLHLQTLIDRMPNLVTLNIYFNQTKSIDLLTNITNSSIRRLNFKENLYFNHKQCHTFVRSSLGKQCEILSIGISNRRDILFLINKMFYLRTLNIRCEDTNNDDENFLYWLKEHLSSTILIQREIEYRHHHIRLWIR